jgi:hypothetical protein
VGADLDAMENRRSRLRGRIEQLRIDLEALGKAGSPTRATARASSRLVATQEQSTRLTQKSDALRKLLIEHDASLHQILLPLAPTG